MTLCVSHLYTSLPLQLSSAEYNCLDDDSKPHIRSAREMLQYGTEREEYWDNVKFMGQRNKLQEWSILKTSSTFDQSSGHTAMAADALVAARMNSDSGAQPKMHDTIMPGGRVQKMVTTVSEAKGLRSVLTERGINCVTLKKYDRIKILSQHDDFRDKKNIESYLLSKGHSVMFFPKVHCEINSIDCVWHKPNSILVHSLSNAKFWNSNIVAAIFNIIGEAYHWVHYITLYMLCATYDLEILLQLVYLMWQYNSWWNACDSVYNVHVVKWLQDP